MGQFSDDDFHFTSLVNYQRHQANAITQLSLRHYREIENEKGSIIEKLVLSHYFRRFRICRRVDLVYVQSQHTRFPTSLVGSVQPFKFRIPFLMNANGAQAEFKTSDQFFESLAQLPTSRQLKR